MPEQEGVLSAKPGIAVRDWLGCGERSRGQRADTSKGKTPSGPLLTHGSMPTANMQRASSLTFPVIGHEVKRIGSWNDPAYSSVHLPHSQGTHGSYNYHKGRLFAGSNIKSDSKDCETEAKSDNQENINFKPSASVPTYGLSGFVQPSAQYESRMAADAFKNVQPSSRLASTSSQSGSTLIRNLKVPEPNPLKHSSNEVAKTSGSSNFFAVKPPKNTFGHMEFNSEVSRYPHARDPNLGSTSILSRMSHPHSSSKWSQSTNKVQTASSSYGPLLKETSMYSSTNPRKPSSSGLKYTEVKSSVVSSGPIIVVKGGGSAQGHGGYSGHPDSVKSLGVPSHVDAYQASQTSRDTRLTASSQGQSWNEPLPNSMSGTQYCPSPELRKPSKIDCRDSVDKSSIVSSGGILLKSPQSTHRNKLPAHYEATHPKFQQAYNVHGQPSQIYKPMYPSRSGAQHDVAKSSTASSGTILIMQGPTNLQSRTESNKPKVHPSFPEHKITYASGQTAHQNQPFEAAKNFRKVRPATSTYASSSRTGYQTFSSVKGPSYKPNSKPSQPSRSELGFSANNPTIAEANEINTVRVRFHKPPTSSFGNSQNQWASGDVSSGAFQSSLPPSYLGQRPGQNVQTPVSSSAPQYYGSKAVQSQFTATRGNADYTRHITAIPSEFGQGAIRRLFPTLSSNYRQAEQNQPQVNRLDSSAPEYPEASVQHQVTAKAATRGRSGPSVVPMESTPSWTSGPIDEGPYQERSVDPVEIEIQHFGVRHKVNKDANGNTTGPETVSFLPAKEEPISGTCMCGPCSSVGSCRKLFCSVLTCGLYRVCRRLPCLVSSESSAINAQVENPSRPPQVENGFYPDVFIGGVKVDTSVIEEDEECVSFSTSKFDMDSPIYLSSLPEDEFISGNETEDVDKLITQKLMEVFSEFEINELAKCTSDSMFLRRSREISQLISDIVQEHNMEEQEAECRLVREIIRISTRKSKKRPQIRPQELQRDSGNDTWNSKKNSQKSSYNSMSDGKLQISMERSDDIEARKLRNNSNQSFSPSFQETGVPITSDTPLIPRSTQA
ncbi:Keratinocyte differentiation factor 1 [Anabarilius grahami]|uniref:Keratinocyte differentiation factor 1 n=1 Tax=Anabarilius grahami TaxID=495550 RepID=A0A3N0XYR7_ANAGA|nr:Keratinocyte differentiation factor 1 [Anabarilius grahami]